MIREMKIALTIAAALLNIATARAGDQLIEQNVVDPTGSYFVKVMPQEKRVEVKRVAPSNGVAPYLRLRVKRKNDRPLEIGLKTLDMKPGDNVLYLGKIDQWKDSYMGLELDFSFDRKTWKRLGQAIEKLVP